MSLNIKTITEYLLNLETNYKEQLEINEKLEQKVKNLSDELENLQKFSIINKFNKQLIEKDSKILLLENQINNLKEKDNELTDEVKEKQKKNKKEYKIINFKNNDYFLETNSNKIYSISNNKKDKFIGNLVNDKIKFI